MDTLAFSHRPVFVLSIDGDGIRGLIPAVILARLEALLAEDGQANNLDHHLGELLGSNQDSCRSDCPLPHAQAAMDDIRSENLRAPRHLGETVVRDKKESLRRVAGLLNQHACVPLERRKPCPYPGKPS